MNGEDGALQGMLEMWQVPYTSSGILGSALGMDKIAMKQVFRANGLPVADDVWVDRNSWKNAREDTLDRIEKALGYPVYVKPANLGSSIGISRAEDRAQLADAMGRRRGFDRMAPDGGRGAGQAGERGHIAGTERTGARDRPDAARHGRPGGSHIPGAEPV